MVWCGLVGAGLWEIHAYATTPGASGAAGETWPATSAIPRASDGFTIVMFVHPECPCSRASLAELTGLVSSARIRPSVVVAFAANEDGGAAWDLAGRIPGAVQMRDSGDEAARFGARTSGHVVVYDREGVLRFTGGITSSRGHVGDNMGRRAVEALLAGDATEAETHPVFGCALETP